MGFFEVTKATKIGRFEKYELEFYGYFARTSLRSSLDAHAIAIAK